MNTRLKYFRKNFLNITQEEFGAKLGITKGAVSSLESGRNAITDQNKIALEREFNLNIAWLESGEGEMFNQLSPDEELSRIVEHELTGDDQFIKNVYIALGKAPKEFRVMLKKFLQDCLKDLDEPEQPIADETPEETEKELIAKYSVEKERGEVG